MGYGSNKADTLDICVEESLSARYSDRPRLWHDFVLIGQNWSEASYTTLLSILITLSISMFIYQSP